jgi:hypothetical protein
LLIYFGGNNVNVIQSDDHGGRENRQGHQLSYQTFFGANYYGSDKKNQKNDINPIHRQTPFMANN